MEEIKTQKVSTAHGELQWYRDWDRDGAITMLNPKTIALYRELKYGANAHPACEDYDVFFAFSDQQFAEGLKKIRPLRDGEKLVSAGAGLYGTRDGVERFIAAYDARDKKIKKECDPQEVYFHEYNNHESMLSWDGDAEPFKIIKKIWGNKIASKITRIK